MNTSITIHRDTGPETFDPQPDITPLEAVRMAQILFCVPGQPRGYNAWDAVKEFGLERHFKADPVTPMVAPFEVVDAPEEITT